MEGHEFAPDGNDLRKVFHYYGLELEEKMLCPFHNDNNPSFHANFDSGVFTCFACGVGGDAFQFVKLANQKLNGLKQLILYHKILNSNKVRKLERLGNRESKRKKDIKKRDRENEQEQAYDYYMGLKTVNWFKVKSEYKDYLLKRGFTSRSLNMCKAKLTIVNESYPIIFPIFDMGIFRGYVCRTTDKVVEKKRKYLYNRGFSRIDTLGGDYDNEVVVLCEGYMDALKLKQFGLKHVAAIFGWKITTKQVEKLKALGVKTIISALDMDEPGRKGTEYLKTYFDVIEFVFPKGVKDPGDLDEKQFKVAYKKTKMLYRRRKNVFTKEN